MPVYQGGDSCYARSEGYYVKRVGRRGVDTLREVAAIAGLILRDYRRGYTYERGSCRRIRMTRGLFEKRLRFLVYLARRHGAPPEVVDAIERLVDYTLRHRRLPKTVRVGDRRVGVGELLRGMYARVKAPRRAAGRRARARKR